VYVNKEKERQAIKNFIVNKETQTTDNTSNFSKSIW